MFIKKKEIISVELKEAYRIEEYYLHMRLVLAGRWLSMEFFTISLGFFVGTRLLLLLPSNYHTNSP